MDLKLYNTLTGRKETFTPLDPGNVRMYVCGPTVYDFAHIGNARPVIVFDVLYRLLMHLAKQGVWDGGKGNTKVTYARNITDVDDKINARAAEEGVPISEVTARTTKQFHEDIAALGVLPPTVEPRATDHIAQMKALIERLAEKGNAYVAEDHVLFHVPSMPDYGKLSKRSLDEMEAGARVEVAPYKKDPKDFVLWKPSKEGEPAWDSPCGIKRQGRPGWHLECSAMSWKHLGETFDIHGGGVDLVFPHHENEIAQSRCCFGTDKMAQVWMHNGYLQVEGEKMSKSLGNFVTLRELLTGWRGFAWPGQVIRLAMLMTHYRQPMDFSQQMLEQAAISLGSFKTFGYLDEDSLPSDEFMSALMDDLNTPRAIAELHRLLGLSRGKVSEVAERTTQPGAMLQEADYTAACELAAGLQFLGIDITNYDPNWVQRQAQSALSDEFREKADALVQARNAARKAKDFAEADRIRDELAGMGVALKDGPEGTTWEIAR